MKHLFLFCLTALLILPLCACSGQAAYTVTRDGKSYEVDKEAQTVSDGEYTYSYTFSGNTGEYELNITYPDGSTYWWQQSSSGMGWGGWSDDYFYYSGKPYTDGDTLQEVILAKAPRAPGGQGVFGAVLLLAGLFGAVFPYGAWYMGHGWRFRDAEPSDLALLVNRVGGIAAAVLGAVLLFS